MKQNPTKVLIADDETSITAGLSAILADEGYVVDVANDGQKAFERLSAERYGVILADLKMPKLDGLSLLRDMQANKIPTECIIITGAGTVETAVDAMRQGAYDYIEKPLTAEKLNRLKALIPKAIDKYNVQQKNRELSSRLEGLTHYGELTGQSDVMREVYSIIEAVAPSTASVMILGESGTGKELVARALHSKSDRAKGTFFPLNCAALPKEILENELFGHEKGAFTGSINEKPGAFEMASGGTIFLDEVAEMSPDIQVKLLRALETKMVRRLGGKKEIHVDIRIVAATNKELQKAMADGELREDLYYRLAVVQIDLPPLRDRAEDIQLLATEFLERFATQNGKKISTFEDKAWDWILSYNWPGNVRELKNAVERAVILARGDKISLTDVMPRHLRIAGEGAATLTIPAGTSLSEGRRRMFLQTLSSTSGDLSRTAKLLGVSDDEVRRELLALVGDSAAAPASPSVAAAPLAPPVVAPKSPLSAAKKSPTKKR
jgi:DNA-binding NtrC family response regulator